MNRIDTNLLSICIKFKKKLLPVRGYSLLISISNIRIAIEKCRNNFVKTKLMNVLAKLSQMLKRSLSISRLLSQNFNILDFSKTSVGISTKVDKKQVLKILSQVYFGQKTQRMDSGRGHIDSRHCYKFVNNQI